MPNSLLVPRRWGLVRTDDSACHAPPPSPVPPPPDSDKVLYALAMNAWMEGRGVVWCVRMCQGVCARCTKCRGDSNNARMGGDTLTRRTKNCDVGVTVSYIY